MSKCDIKVKVDKDGVWLVLAQLVSPQMSKAQLLAGVYYNNVVNSKMTLKDFAEFRAQVEETDLSNEGLIPTISACRCGYNVIIYTYLGESDPVWSFEELEHFLLGLTCHSIITTHDADRLMKEARRKASGMAELETGIDEEIVATHNKKVVGFVIISDHDLPN